MACGQHSAAQMRAALRGCIWHALVWACTGCLALRQSEARAHGCCVVVVGQTRLEEEGVMGASAC